MARCASRTLAPICTGGLLVALSLSAAPRGLAAESGPPPFELTVDSHLVLLPAPGGSELDDGYVATGEARGAYAVRVEVRAQDAAAPWSLHLRAEGSSFRSEGSGKPCHDLRWKFDHEASSAYRPLEDRDAIVLERPDGGSAEVVIDLRVDLGWATPPGMYGLGLVFSLVPE